MVGIAVCTGERCGGTGTAAKDVKQGRPSDDSSSNSSSSDGEDGAEESSADEQPPAAEDVPSPEGAAD